MKRLVAFGCSHTWGEAITKNHSSLLDKSLKASKYSWPYLLGNLLDVEVINISKSGESNKAIAHKILNFNFLPDDIVIPLWTHIETRSCIIQNFNKSEDTNYERIYSWYKENDDSQFSKKKYDWIDLYFKNFHTNADSKFESLSYIQSSNFILNSKVKTIINCFAIYHNLNFIKKYSSLTNIFNKPFYEGYLKYGLAFDNVHLSLKANEEFAKELYDFLKKEKKINII